MVVGQAAVRGNVSPILGEGDNIEIGDITVLKEFEGDA